MNGTFWTDERVARLTDLWNDGVSAGLIGKKLDISKNAVVGKAHRLKLPGRPSPILHQGTAEARRRGALARATGQREGIVPLAAGASEASPSLAPHRPCLFIEGERGVDFALYAEAPRCPVPAMLGSPYCPAHHRFTHVRRQVEEAA